VIVVFTFSGSVGARWIRRFDGGAFSHCFPVFSGRAIEALPGPGVFERGETAAIGGSENQAYWLPDDSEDSARAAEAYARSLIGARYDHWAIPSLALRAMFGTAPHWERPGCYYCDEMTLMTAAVASQRVKNQLRGWAGRYGVEAARQILIEAGAVPV